MRLLMLLLAAAAAAAGALGASSTSTRAADAAAHLSAILQGSLAGRVSAAKQVAAAAAVAQNISTAPASAWLGGPTVVPTNATSTAPPGKAGAEAVFRPPAAARQPNQKWTAYTIAASYSRVPTNNLDPLTAYAKLHPAGLLTGCPISYSILNFGGSEAHSAAAAAAAGDAASTDADGCHRCCRRSCWPYYCYCPAPYALPCCRCCCRRHRLASGPC